MVLHPATRPPRGPGLVALPWLLAATAAAALAAMVRPACADLSGLAVAPHAAALLALGAAIALADALAHPRALTGTVIAAVTISAAALLAWARLDLADCLGPRDLGAGAADCPGIACMLLLPAPVPQQASPDGLTRVALTAAIVVGVAGLVACVVGRYLRTRPLAPFAPPDPTGQRLAHIVAGAIAAAATWSLVQIVLTRCAGFTNHLIEALTGTLLATGGVAALLIALVRPRAGAGLLTGGAAVVTGTGAATAVWFFEHVPCMTRAATARRGLADWLFPILVARTRGAALTVSLIVAIAVSAAAVVFLAAAAARRRRDPRRPADAP